MIGRLLGAFGLSPYVLGALALAFVGMGGAILYYRGAVASERADKIAAQADAAKMRGERDTAILLNAAKDQEIARLSRQAQINNDIMADLHKAMHELNANIEKQQEALEKAANDDPALDDWLSSPIPDSYRRLRGQR